MTLALYAHPFSSYSQKALVALYENATPFEFRMISPASPDHTETLKRLWPVAKFPLLEDGKNVVVEATIIIEYLDTTHPGPVRLVPDDRMAATEVRMMDRVFDNYVMTPMSRIVGDALREPEARDPRTVAEARTLLDTAYAWLDQRMAEREWAAGDTFTLADCAAAPSLFYADWTHPIGDGAKHLKTYRKRLLARPSFARAVDEARPYRHYFPLGAPNRD